MSEVRMDGYEDTETNMMSTTTELHSYALLYWQYITAEQYEHTGNHKLSK